MSGTTFAFSLPGQPDPELTAYAFTGTEAISRPFRFEIDLVGQTEDLDLDAMLGREAALTLEWSGGRREIRGIIERFAATGASPTNAPLYRAVLVAPLAIIGLNHEYQVYGVGDDGVTVLDIVRAEVTGRDRPNAASDARSLLSRMRLDDRTMQSWYPAREHVVQYGESGLAFIHRLMERVGIFYFFDGAATETLVIADDNAAIPDLPGGATLSFAGASGQAFAGPHVFGFAARREPLSGRFILHDYNYRLPRLRLQSEIDLDPAAPGVRSEFGAHFRSPEEGRHIARVREEEMRCWQTTYHGRSVVGDLRAGHRFTLDGHPDFVLDRRYIVAAVSHEGWQAVADAPENATGHGGPAGYRNHFTGVSADRPFRPRRVTPWPRVPGFLSARVGATADAQRAELDEEGRYTLRLPFDLAGRATAKASRPIRMLQPYGGASEGMHFPLRPGTEVTVTHVNGDPDRPIITGTLPNPTMPSLSTLGSETRNRLVTSAGITLQLSDGTAVSGDGSGDEVASALVLQQNADAGQTSVVSYRGDTVAATISVPGYDGAEADSYLRLGAADSASESGYTGSLAWSVDGNAITSYDGWLGYTDGNWIDHIATDHWSHVTRHQTREIGGDLTIDIGSASGSDTCETLSYGSSRDETITGSDSITVDGATDVLVYGADSASISGDLTETNTAGADTMFDPGADGALAATSYQKTVSYDGGFTDSIAGNANRTYTDGKSETIAGGSSTTVVGTETTYKESTSTATYLGLYSSRYEGKTTKKFHGGIFKLAFMNAGLKMKLSFSMKVYVAAYINIFIRSSSYTLVKMEFPTGLKYEYFGTLTEMDINKHDLPFMTKLKTINLNSTT